MSCACSNLHVARRIVLTGGPGAGKTAVLALIREALCRHVRVLPEAAGVVFGGGFPRGGSVATQAAAQRAIFYVQRELEAAAEGEDATIVMCDRGTVDGLAYWSGAEPFWASVGSSLDEQLRRYHAVIHLRTPSEAGGYDHTNPLRIETAVEAASLDARIAEAWAEHPRRFFVEPQDDFLAKTARVLEFLRAELPACCRDRVVPNLPPTET